MVSFVNNAYMIVLIYTTFVILEMYYIQKYITNWHSFVVGSKTDYMQWNIEHRQEINTAFEKELEKRLEMLKTMDYSKWLNYNNEFTSIRVGEYAYNIAVYERVKNTNANYNVKDRFLLRSHKIKENIGLTYQELLKQANYTFLFSIFSPHPQFLDTIFDSSHYKGGVNLYSYFSVDGELNRPVKSNAIGGKFQKQDGEGGDLFEGVIYASYSLLDVEEQYANKFYDFLSKKFLIGTSLITLVVSLLLYYSSANKDTIWLPFGFLIASHYYIISFNDVVEGITTLENEEDKVKDINEGILSISFLAAVNVFIIQSLRDGSNRNSYYEAAIMFMLGLVMLLLSLYKITNYNRIDEIRVHRIEKQFMYNGSIYINVFILLYYSWYVMKEGNIPSKIVSSIVDTLNNGK